MKIRKIHKDNDILAKKDSTTDRRLEKLEQVASQRHTGLMVVMEDVYNPYNLAAIARSCDAFGVQFLSAILQNSKNFDPKEVVNIAATSASKWLNYKIYETEGTVSALNEMKQEGWHIYATVAPRQDRPVHSLYDTNFTQHDKVVLLVGNEHTGLSDEAIQMADTLITIPMVGMIQSFNVSVATAISLSEIVRQRRATGDFSKYLLSKEDAKILSDDFLMRQFE